MPTPLNLINIEQLIRNKLQAFIRKTYNVQNVLQDINNLVGQDNHSDLIDSLKKLYTYVGYANTFSFMRFLDRRYENIFSSKQYHIKFYKSPSFAKALRVIPSSYCQSGDLAVGYYSNDRIHNINSKAGSIALSYIEEGLISLPMAYALHGFYNFAGLPVPNINTIHVNVDQDIDTTTLKQDISAYLPAGTNVIVSDNTEII